MLLDQYLPVYDVRARYQTDLPAPPERVYSLVVDLDWSRSPLVRWLVLLRGMGSAKIKLIQNNPPGQGFTVLGEEPDRELLVGMAGRFWLPTAPLRQVDPADFVDFAGPGDAKMAMNFLAEPLPGGNCRLSTETRVQCFGPSARRCFRLYWGVIGPFSGLIRKEAFRLVRRQLAEGD
ncbi:MAG: hypothetical protein K9K66_04705 [Desulfarculaceae bacterium]|nr:hypothetical protein [Desulfarculaceae bacterium]MCF8072772.1 hypothetical protein [Desulfarculaceae bacterium]MCF8100940.1 hypothetical protein [Desulfarculaceae bacterium]MCF8117576.1 hypothetical protein [Desulfarculaceae bacterium]